MKITIIRLLCLFIPVKSWRKKLKNNAKNKDPILQIKNSISQVQNSISQMQSQIQESLNNLIIKSSLQDDIFQMDNIKFYVPDFPLDLIQKIIVTKKSFFEQDILEELDAYLNEDSVIFDIGANIGNHTVYWGLKTKVKKIIAIEAVTDTFNKLTKNIEINNLENKVTAYNFGVSNSNDTGEIYIHNIDNIGWTCIRPAKDGNITLKKLDSIDFKVDKVDFIKVDIEGMENLFIEGATKFLKKYKPLIFIESDKTHIDKTMEQLSKLGYKQNKKHFDYSNYLFEFKK